MTKATNDYATIALIAILSLMGCDSRSSQPTRVSDEDRRIAAETIELVKPQVAASGELIRRHGKFVSLDIRTVRRSPPLDVFDLHEPAMLVIDCYAIFEDFSTKIEVRVFDGAAFNISMEPTEKFATKENSPLSDCQLVQDGDELWFVRTGGDQMRVQSIVTCQTSHPDFEP